jgi:uncharacterized LabA/DUF88 family protein
LGVKVERVIIFIDGSNFYYGLKENIGLTQIDFYYFAQKLTEGRKYIRTYYYNVALDAKEDQAKYASQQRFFNKLSFTPYLILKLGRLQKTNAGYVEKGVDIKIAVDMFKLAHDNVYDTAILVTSDGDFVPVIEVIQELGKHVENAYFGRGHSFHLRKACDKFIELDRSFFRAPQ